MATNPWIAIHKQNTDRTEQQLVDQEFEGTEIYDDTCGQCNSPAFYRSTVGAVQCPNCGSLLLTPRLPGGGLGQQYWSTPR